MRRLAALAAIVAVTGIGAGATAASTKPSLRVVSWSPLAFRGQEFAAREKVRVELWGVARAIRYVIATRTGSFTVRFADVTTTRCDMVRVVALGSRGNRAVFKFLPAPACHTG